MVTARLAVLVHIGSSRSKMDEAEKENAFEKKNSWKYAVLVYHGFVYSIFYPLDYFPRSFQREMLWWRTECFHLSDSFLFL